MPNYSFFFCYVFNFFILFCSLSTVCAKNISSTIGDGQCIWSGICGDNPDSSIFIKKKLNCVYNGPGKILNDKKGVSILEELCPELVSELLETYGNITTCCTTQQLAITKKQIKQLENIVKNCPACFSNIKKHYCYFACHPRHSAFLNPMKFVKNKEGKDMVYVVEEFLSETYINEAYSACEDVYSPFFNGPAFSMMCGQWGQYYCTPKRLFDYFGNNPLAPFKINTVYGNENTMAFNYTSKKQRPVKPFVIATAPCNTTDPELSCGCVDCASTCQLPPHPKEDEKIKVGSITLYTFLIIIFYAVFALGFFIFSRTKGLPGNSKEKTEDCCSKNHKISATFETFLQTSFKKLALVVCRNALLVLGVGIVAVVIMCCGITKLKMTTDPVKLWAAPDSKTRNEKDYFDQNFGPFYRTNQIIITPVGVESFNYTTKAEATIKLGPVFNETFMREVMNVQLQIMALTGEYENKTVTLNDVCMKPLEPNYDDCLIQSVMNYWQNDPEKLDKMIDTSFQDYIEHYMYCVHNPTYMTEEETCMGTYGGPVLPYVALGGYLSNDESLNKTPPYEKSTALVITFLGKNYVDTKKLGPANAWEKVFLDFMKNFSHPLMDVAFYSERGIQDEIQREGKGDISTVLISYLVMFTYVTITLGGATSDCSRFFIETKMVLGLCSVLLVFASVISSIGLCSFFGVEGSLFVVEVIPFLALAIGVDNIYLLVQTWQREPKISDESSEEHISRVVGKIAPSMLLATCSEAICFFLGAISEMPAVHSFAIFAGTALSIGFVLQITCLVALMALDARRVNNNLYDVLCCIRGPKESKGKEEVVNNDRCLSFFQNCYAPLLLKDTVRVLVVLIFTAGFCTSVSYLPNIDQGLEQDIGMPSDSFMIKYFDYFDKYLSVGSPVYFVIKDGYNFTDTDEQNLICYAKSCRNDSVLSQIFWASRAPEITTIASGANDWLGSYFDWISDGINSKDVTKACCRLDENDNFINSSVEVAPNAKRTCLTADQMNKVTNRPIPEVFMEYIDEFLIDNPHNITCPQAGHAAYASSVVVEKSSNNKSRIGANNFMAYHTRLTKSKDFTRGLKEAYTLTDELNKYLRENSKSETAEIFPYSIFYVFYEQYLTMGATTAKSLGLSYLTVFLVMIILSGLDIKSSLINLIVIIMITLDIMGLMVWWNIQLNAISLVNLVMAVGISVEFCNHITHAFAFTSSGTKVERAAKSLTYTGSSVFSGITVTKFAGIIVLAFANSNVITVFYFRMYLLIVLVGAAHGLIFLPVLLSLIGPSPNHFIEQEVEDNSSKPVGQKYVNLGFEGTISSVYVETPVDGEKESVPTPQTLHM